MALKWIEGFEGFGVNDSNLTADTIITRKYPNSAGVTSMRPVGGRFGGQALQFRASNCKLKSPSVNTHHTFTVGFAFRLDSGAGYDQEIVTHYGSDGVTRGMNLRRTATGELAVYKADSLFAATSGLNLIAGPWYYIEFLVFANSVGYWEVRVNGQNVLSGGGNTVAGNAPIYNARFSLNGAGFSTYTFDDLYASDGNTPDPAGFAGVKQVVTIFPDGAGDLTEMEPSSGANWECVDEATAADDDSSYVQSDTTDTDLYTFTDLQPSQLATGVLGVQINADARMTGAGGPDRIDLLAKLGVTVDEPSSPSAVNSETYVTATRVLPLNPAGAAWTATDINNAQFGVRPFA